MSIDAPPGGRRSPPPLQVLTKTFRRKKLAAIISLKQSFLSLCRPELDARPGGDVAIKELRVDDARIVIVEPLGGDPDLEFLCAAEIQRGPRDGDPALQSLALAALRRRCHPG